MIVPTDHSYFSGGVAQPPGYIFKRWCKSMQCHPRRIWINTWGKRQNRKLQKTWLTSRDFTMHWDFGCRDLLGTNGKLAGGFITFHRLVFVYFPSLRVAPCCSNPLKVSDRHKRERLAIWALYPPNSSKFPLHNFPQARDEWTGNLGTFLGRQWAHSAWKDPS